MSHKSNCFDNNSDDCQEQPTVSGVQTHTHEFLGSTKLAEEGDDRHNHRFAGVTSEVIIVPGGHVHEFLVNTDFVDHHHEVGARTELQKDVGDGKHVHFVKDRTTFVDNHCHVFQFATLIQSPLLPTEDCN